MASTPNQWRWTIDGSLRCDHRRRVLPCKITIVVVFHIFDLVLGRHSRDGNRVSGWNCVPIASQATAFYVGTHLGSFCQFSKRQLQRVIRMFINLSECHRFRGRLSWRPLSFPALASSLAARAPWCPSIRRAAARATGGGPGDWQIRQRPSFIFCRRPNRQSFKGRDMLTRATKRRTKLRSRRVLISG